MRRIIRLPYFFIPLVFPGLISCDSNREPVQIGYEYFPLETGRYTDYEVSEEIYIPDGTVESLNYQLRVQVADSFPNDGGSVTYVLYRYTRNAPEEPWTFQSTWSARREEIRGITVEGNIPFQSLSFPVRNGLRWDGNILNSGPPDDYTMDSLGVEYTIDGFGTASSLTVIQEDLFDLVIGEEDRRYEVYMQGIGLVEKSMRQLDICNSGGCSPGSIISGRIYLQKAIGYGNE